MQDGVEVGELVMLGPHTANGPEFDQYTVNLFSFDPTFKAHG